MRRALCTEACGGRCVLAPFSAQRKAQQTWGTQKKKRGREQRQDTTVNPLAKKKLPPTGRKPGGVVRASGQPSGPKDPQVQGTRGHYKSIPCYGGASNHYRIELSNIKGL